ncbi:MAG: DUF971 domain-containing protein [Chloroflexi bacterium]|nr:DUF971 domain-containing protein [Chloroflexota bacterium]
MTEKVSPSQITVDTKQRIVQVTWDDEHVSQYDFDYLRRICPCADCRPWIHGVGARDVMPAKVKNARGDIRGPQDLSLVGGYALNVEFADGHSTGIYTWQYLRQMCACVEHAGKTA